VVKKNPTALGGTVEISSAEGYGMSVAVGGECYILPLACVVESFLVRLDTLRLIGGGSQVVEVRNEYMPAVDLPAAFAVPSGRQDTTDRIMVVVESEGLRASALVEALLGLQQLVVKNLEASTGGLTVSRAPTSWAMAA